MAHRILVRPAATADSEEHEAYISGDNLDAALLFQDAVRETYEALARMPNSGSPRYRPVTKLSDVRYFPVRGFPRFLVFYRPVVDGIEIGRVLHGARDIAAILIEIDE